MKFISNCLVDIYMQSLFKYAPVIADVMIINTFLALLFTVLICIPSWTHPVKNIPQTVPESTASQSDVRLKQIKTIAV